jgi:hypothetical protein
VRLLIVFHRGVGEIVERKQYGDEPHERGRSISDRLVREQIYGPDHEVVVLAAEDITTMKRTHSRYFVNE